MIARERHFVSGVSYILFVCSFVWSGVVVPFDMVVFFLVEGLLLFFSFTALFFRFTLPPGVLYHGREALVRQG